MLTRLFEWFISSPPAQTFAAAGALVYAMRHFRRQSRGEHRTTLNAIKGVGEQVNGGLLANITNVLARLDRIEKRLEIEENDEAR